MCKRIITIIFLSIFLQTISAQVSPPAPYNGNVKLNYVRTWDATAPEQVPATLITRPLKDVKQSTSYFDGLGRPLQTVIKQGSLQTGNNARDLVSSVVYDGFGREVHKYLTFAANDTGGNTSLSDGLFKLNPFQQQAAFNGRQFPGETYYYTQSNYEASPLNRVEKSMQAGNSWVGSNRGVVTKYWLNTSADDVKIGAVTNNAYNWGTYNLSGAYAAGELFKTVTIDEQGSQAIEFKDKGGKVILIKRQHTAVADDGTGEGYAGWLCTYYLYDDLNMLRLVVQPKGVELLIQNSWNINALDRNIINEQCFRYEYDERGRMSMKKVPGAGEVWMVYDKRDRLVLTHDPRGRCLFTKYDALNRPIITGVYLRTFGSAEDMRNTYELKVANESPAEFEERINVYDNHFGYTNNSFPSLYYSYDRPGGTEVLTVAYYDNYSWCTLFDEDFATMDHSLDNQFPFASNSTYPYPQPLAQSNKTKGRITGGITFLINTIEQFDPYSDFQLYATYYDDDGRVVQTKKQNIATGIDITTTQYNFSGQILQTILKHQKSGVNPQTHTVITKLGYDDLGRRLTTKKTINSTINGQVINKPEQMITNNQFNALGGLKSKALGSGIESLNYEYNIQGWLTSANKSYINNSSNGNYFGFELGYDKTTTLPGTTSFLTPQFNGNISGSIWKSKGDDINRKYDYSYDHLDRLTAAGFTQNSNGSSWDKTVLDFSVHGLSYDANGNILTMNQRGWKPGGNITIDSLAYTYYDHSNKLMNVIDFVNDTLTKAGDFRSSTTYMGMLNNNKTAAAIDYEYDVNGSLVKDLNKDIGHPEYLGMEYNHLNLPATVYVENKGSIQYFYDGTGTKLKKVVRENGKPEKTSLYIGEFFYENDTLQFVGHEEGRIRYAKKYFQNGDSSFQFFYDYFLKDHLGNTRMVLTEQKDTSHYVATMESAYRAKENKLFGNIQQTSYAISLVPGGYPTDGTTTTPNDSLARVNASGKKVGPSLVLKVMSGDKIDLGVKSFYRSQGSGGGYNDALTDILSSLADGIISIAGEGKGTMSQLSNGTTSPLIGAFNSFRPVNNPNPALTKPKAFLNWILLDEQFNYVSASSGAIPVNTPDVIEATANSGITLTRNGFLYIYVSNETQNWDVFFNDLSVKHYTGAMLEETHYYPFGLTMGGISSKAVKPNYVENFQKYNGITFENAIDLNIYDAQLRELDPQIGRWWQVDPKIENMEMWSPYVSNFDNPIKYSDLLGDKPIEGCCGEFVEHLKDAAVAVTGAMAATVVGGFDNFFSTNVRGSVAASDILTDPRIARGWNLGLDVADAGSIAVGGAESTFGGGLLKGSLAVTAATGGASVEVTGGSALLGGLMTVHGLVLAKNGVQNLESQNGRVQVESKQTGSYTNTHESGKKYHGKGPKERAKQSADKKAYDWKDPFKNIEWKPASNDREAFKAEAKRIKTDGGVENPNNYNQRNSPGRRYNEEDKKLKRNQ